MKRSRSITLTIFSAATAASLAGCDQTPPDTAVQFDTVEQCVAAGNAADTCKLGFDKALETHVENSPRYQDQGSCEAAVDVDRCVKTQVRQKDGTLADVFIPAMAGYMIGRALSPDRRSDRSYYGGGYYGSPVYRSRLDPNSYRGLSSSGSGLSRLDGARGGGGSVSVSRPSSGVPSVTAPSRPSNVGTTTISRGGFGGTGGGFGGGGS
jgi:uncharacterized protein YgiB involved in biofilm formation